MCGMYGLGINGGVKGTLTGIFERWVESANLGF